MSTIIIEYNSEVAVRRFLKKMFLKILQNPVLQPFSVKLLGKI